MSESQQFLKKASWFMILDNISKVAEPFLKLTCAKLFVGGAWGEFVFLESLVLMIIRFCLMGFDKGTIWSFGQSEKKEAYFHHFSKMFNLVFLLSLVVTLALIFLPSQGISFLKNQSDVSHLNQIYMYSSIPFVALTVYLLQSLINVKNLATGILVKNIVLPLTTFGLPLLVYYCPKMVESDCSIILNLPLSYLIAQILGFVIAFGVFVKSFKSEIHLWSWSFIPPRPVLQFSLPLSLSDFLNSVVLRVDNVLLMQYTGSQGVEVYSIAILVAKTFLSIRESFDSVLLSIFSKATDEPYPQEKKESYNYSVWFVMSIQIPLFFVIWFFGRDLIEWWEPKYLPGENVILVTSLFLILAGPGIMTTSLLVGLGKTMWIPLIQAVFFGGVILFNFLLIPNMGALGAGIAFGLSTLLSAIVGYMITTFYARKSLIGIKCISSIGITFILFIPLFLAHLIDQAYWLQVTLLFLGLIGQVILIKKGLRYWNRKPELKH